MCHHIKRIFSSKKALTNFDSLSQNVAISSSHNKSSKICVFLKILLLLFAQALANSNILKMLELKVQLKKYIYNKIITRP